MKKIIFILIIVLIWCLGSTQQSVQAAGHIDNKTQYLRVSFKGHHFKACLKHNKAAQDLVKQLPIRLHFRSFNTPEKLADLNQPLSTKGMTVGEDPAIGDIGYWSPEPRLVFYWGNVDYFNGIHVIGHFNKRQTAARVLQQQKHPFTVTIKLIKANK
ncbi:cyclophilin-like fold protein [Bombilactobacillus bombi]|uniref:cyclophilin-like fold protein n=1 Tax=Bombilactobacillus bombi TaxID=1303590 RepID=UPI0015E5A2CA|nr:cyclophilin-like fold protein [Bombilactobacillus bombi]MBA1435254.1 hypothetical protein [Bombilactobacillus bombi]